MNSSNLQKTKWGWYQFKNKPTQEELNEYYKNKYFKIDDRGNYKINYEDSELKHKIYRNFLTAQKAINLLDDKAKSAFDIGCGEGFLVKEFFKRGLEVKACDYSNQIGKFFPELLEYNLQGDLYEVMEKEFSTRKYDIITTLNVLEHVINPEEFIQIAKKGMNSDSILVITIPNDFNDFQKHLLDKKTTTERWLCYPDHLNYFNIKSMHKFLDSFGIEIVSKVANFPIDMFLLNDVLNYDKDATKGKAAYSITKDFDLYLSTLDTDKVLNFYESLAGLELGRDITYYCKLKK